MQPADNVLQTCAITREELDALEAIVLDHFRPALGDALEQRESGITGVNSICELSALVRRLSGVRGFPAVKKSINRATDVPHGDWFHLRVAYLLHGLGEEISLEQKVNGTPKDILLREGQVIVECKSFTVGDRFNDIISRCLNRGIDPIVSPDAPPAFTRSVGFLGFLPGRPEYFSIQVNEFPRFLANGLMEKKKQVVPGRCNILALDTREFTNDPRKLRGPIASILDSEEFEEVAAVLSVQGLPFGPEDYTKRGLSYLADLVESPRFVSTKRENRVPADLAERICGTYFIGCPNR
jgi:hypothetical protein